MLRGTIQLDVSKATEEAPAKSELLDIGGYKWQLICPSDCSLDCFTLVCNENCTDRLWLCKAKCSVETKEGNSGWKKLKEIRTQYWFNSYGRWEGNGLGTPNLIKADIEVEWSQPNLPKLDASLNMIFGGISLLVPINKFVLAGHSNYFRIFFFGDGDLAAVSKRKDTNGSPIFDIQENPDFDYWQFRFMIYGVLCMGSMLDQLGDIDWASKDKEHKIALLKMAVKFQLQMFVDFAEKALIKLGPGTMELLALADQFTLAGLKDHCLTSITSIEYCKQIVENSEIRAGLGKETRAQLDAKLKECANKGWKLV